MIRIKIGHWLVITTTLICLTACGKREGDITATPELSRPSESEPVHAQAEVKASSGPIELSLLIHKMRLKAGDSIWQQIRLRNIGQEQLVIADRIFKDPRDLRNGSSIHYGIYLEALGPDGRALELEFIRSSRAENDIGNGVTGLLEVNGPDEQAMVEGWRKDGLSPEKINLKLLDFNLKSARTTGGGDEHATIELAPGQSIDTKSAFYYSMQDKIRNRPVPQPIGNFMQVDFFLLEKPGKYKIRAVYDHRPSAVAKKLNIKRRADDVLVRTPWVTITVLP